MTAKAHESPPETPPQASPSPAVDDALDGFPPERDGDGSVFADLPEPGKYANRFKCVLRCTGIGEELDGDDVVTVAKFKHSHHEEGMRVSLRVRAQGADFLRRKFKTREYYGLVIREAPSAPGGHTVNLKLDGELASLVVSCTEIGSGVPIRKDGDAVAIVKFSLYDLPEGHGDLYSAGLQFTVEGVFHGDNFELQNAYRMAITPPPEYVLEAERSKANRFEDSPLGKAISSATNTKGLTTDSSIKFADDGLSAVLTMPDGTKRELTPKELENLKNNLGKMLKGGTNSLTPGTYVLDEEGQITKDGEVVSLPGTNVAPPEERKVKGKKKQPGESLGDLYKQREGDAPMDAIALESGRVIGFVTDDDIRKMAAEQAISVEEPSENKPYKTYVVPARGPLPGQYKDPKASDDDAPPPPAKKAASGKKAK